MRMKKSKKIDILCSELQMLSPTDEELDAFCNWNDDGFITNNSWRSLNFGESYHVHIGIKKDAYLGVEQTEELIKNIKKMRS